MSDLFSGIANLTKTVTDTLTSYEVRKISDKVQSYVMNYTEPELKVREATSEEPWGPTPDMMREISNLTFQYDAFPEVMGMLWKRMLPPSPVAWRHTYKSLILLEYLLKNGCERVISNARDHMFEMRSLEHYKCVNERGKDEGINVRYRVKAVLSLLEDDDLLRAERRKAKDAGKDSKYKGFSRDEMTMRGFSGSSSSSKNFSHSTARKSNFDMDAPYDRDNRFDDDMPSNNREVTAFDFGHKRDASPELGFPADVTPEKHDDDDDFGDFIGQRTKSTTPAQNHSTTTFDDFGDFKASFPSPTVPTTTSSMASKTDDFFGDLMGPSLKSNAPAQTQSNTRFDSLGDFRTSFPSPPSTTSKSSFPSAPLAASKSVDLLGDILGPSANSNTTVQNQAATVFDDFGDFKVSLSTTSTMPSKSDDLFGDILGSPSKSITPTQNQSASTFDEFGGFKASLSSPVPMASKSDDLFGDIFTKTTTPAPSIPSTPHSSQPSKENTATPQNKSALWNDLSGSLDLDNLLSTKPKQTVSMNEMKNKQGGMSSGSNIAL